jgi:hypothetical protein
VEQTSDKPCQVVVHFIYQEQLRYLSTGSTSNQIPDLQIRNLLDNAVYEDVTVEQSLDKQTVERGSTAPSPAVKTAVQNSDFLKARRFEAVFVLCRS